MQPFFSILRRLAFSNALDYDRGKQKKERKRLWP